MATTPVPRSLLALVGLAVLHLLACGTTTAEDLLVHSPTTDTTTTLPPHASVFALVPDEPTTPTGRPASCNRLAASPSASTVSGVSQHQRRLLLDTSVVIARQDNATATAPATTPPSPSPRVGCVDDVAHAREAEAAAVDGILQTTPGATGTTAPSTTAAVLRALPLLAIPFLPPPLAALVVLSSLATPVRAFSDDRSVSGSVLTHATATCTVYRYYHDSGTIDRTRPFADLRAVCPPRPLRNAAAGGDERALSGACGRRRGFRGYCSVNTLVVGVVPATGARCLCRVAVHLPVGDRAAVVAAGGDLCYVELEHMDYREGYYILCPIRDCFHEPVVCCTEFPLPTRCHCRRRLGAPQPQPDLPPVRDTFGWYNNSTASPHHEGEKYQYHDEL